MENERTCSEFIVLILKRGGRWRNKQIERAILQDYGVQFQSNTIAKYLSFLIKDGKALSAPVTDKKESPCYEYWWIVEAPKKAVAVLPQSSVVLIEKCMKTVQTYPDGHNQIEKIMNQVDKIESREGVTA